MFAITGASGNTGGVVAERLLSRGAKVRVIGRNAEHLSRLAQKGAEPFVANATDADAMARAFDGVSGVYVMIPPNPTSPDIRDFQEKVSDALASAIRKASVGRAVMLSSIGADKPDKTGPVVALHNLEQKLTAIDGLNAVYLRAGYFMENLLSQAEVIRNFGFAAGPLRPDLSLPMIASRDIGAAAAAILVTTDFSGKQPRELLGQRHLDYREATSVIGKAIGKPDLAYNQLPVEQLKQALTQMGMSANFADLLLEMAESLNSGYMASLEMRSAHNTTPTSFETFVAQDFMPRFQAKSASA